MSTRRFLPWIAILLCLAGVAMAGGGMITYLTRYSTVDSKYGEIDDQLYREISVISSSERAFVTAGIVCVVLAVVAAIVTLVLRRSTTRKSSL